MIKLDSQNGCMCGKLQKFGHRASFIIVSFGDYNIWVERKASQE